MSKWASSVTLLSKEKQKTELLCHVQKAQRYDVQHTYPLPQKSDCNRWLGIVAIFSTSDWKISYRLIEMSKADRDKTIFSSLHGLFQFICMFFGMKSMAASSHSLAETMPSRLQSQIRQVYLNDSILHSRSVTKNFGLVHTVLTLL